MARRAIYLAAAVGSAVLGFASSAAARPVREGVAPGYTITSAPYEKLVHLQVTYAGTGSWGTLYRSEPPNPGGNPDHNYAWDSSAQNWALVYTQVLTVPACGSSVPNPCALIQSLAGATGRTSTSGRVSHLHIDGLYTADNAYEACRVSLSTTPGESLDATMQLRYAPGAGALAITALDPVVNALAILPAQCPGQGDSIDGLSDNYFTPGFSFASGYGPDRWFTSRTVSIPLTALHRSSRITIPLGDTPAGAPPRGCAVQDPAYEQCLTGGSWSGVLTLTRQPSS